MVFTRLHRIISKVFKYTHRIECDITEKAISQSCYFVCFRLKEERNLPNSLYKSSPALTSFSEANCFLKLVFTFLPSNLNSASGSKHKKEKTIIGCAVVGAFQ